MRRSFWNFRPRNAFATLAFPTASFRRDTLSCYWSSLQHVINSQSNIGKTFVLLSIYQWELALTIINEEEKEAKMLFAAV